MDGIDRVYWDSCIFIALLKKETTHRPGELDFIQSQALRFDMGLIGIMTSSIALVEVLQAKFDDDSQRRQFTDMTKRSNFQFIEASHRVCEVAAEIRNFYINPLNHSGLNVSTPDAIHVASVIAAQSTLGKDIMLLTFDSEDKKKDMALTKLNGVVAGKYKVEITRPKTEGQMSLAVDSA